ncbi:hypothetical protein FHW88_005265 [Mucilaginibacter sp. SG538B]|uniref:hypothetical protein n=1 Tax=Mucilaginibacter sp. SG538B TaxID=2587021 RepID=UPI00179C6F0C|nr:hypothetical protein [Mucilaginibacter sp. SG538B]NVM66947.1 hypothetical protein [Mucilaginibacter sp. SG538B]
MHNKFQCILSLLFTGRRVFQKTAEKEGQAFYEENNKAAGTRLRNALQQIKVIATDLRKDVTKKKNAEK